MVKQKKESSATLKSSRNIPELALAWSCKSALQSAMGTGATSPCEHKQVLSPLCQGLSQKRLPRSSHIKTVFWIFQSTCAELAWVSVFSLWLINYLLIGFNKHILTEASGLDQNKERNIQYDAGDENKLVSLKNSNKIHVVFCTYPPHLPAAPPKKTKHIKKSTYIPKSSSCFLLSFLQTSTSNISFLSEK